MHLTRLALTVVLTIGSTLFASGLMASTLIYNVTAYTMDHGERVSFVALEYADGVVTHIYRDADALQARSDKSEITQRIDGEGATLLPGLIDAHGHVAGYGQALAGIDLTGSRTEAEAVARVADAVAKNDGDDGWLSGDGWNQVLWPTQAFPNRQSLDRVTGKRPTVLYRVDGHAMWVNSVVLALAGIDNETADPEGGQILRDASGAATGVLIDNAMALVSSQLPASSEIAVKATLERALQSLASKGLTTVHDAGVGASDLLAYRALHAEGRMPIRSYVMLSVLDPANDEQLAAGPYRSADGLLSVRSVKISADGALGSRGAALHADYSDQPGHRGLLLLSEADLARHMQRSAAAGYQVNVHAIGDLANTRVLDEFERLNRDSTSRALRHRVEHAQILRPDDIARFKSLGVIASVQPTHATSDKNMAGDRLGEARLEGAYAWQTLFESGARLAGGSDFPVEPPDPFYGLHAAVTRQDRDGKPPGGWRVGEALSRNQALSLFTEDAAYAGHAEKRIGRLLPDYAADFILVRDDFFAVPREQLWQNKVIATVVGGKLVYGEL